jgi:hypothetical protein
MLQRQGIGIDSKTTAMHASITAVAKVEDSHSSTSSQRDQSSTIDDCVDGFLGWLHVGV